ncbi:MAG: RNA methyltransferase [Victivallales bacterium]|nr:RNA methyltransferase [Victivallales bacterium]MCF7888796.1 RNA methyltransferase [Victivallales bacterium]
MYRILTRKQEKLINSLSRRKKRNETGLCICEGLRVCKEVYQKNRTLIKFGVAKSKTDIHGFEDVDFYMLPEGKFEKLTDTVNSQGILFIVKIPDISNDISKQGFYIVLDRIGDPGNLGTILRTAAAVGIKEIWYSKGTVDPFSEKTVRSALGAQFKLNLIEYIDLNIALEALRANRGIERFYRTDPAGGINCFNGADVFNKSAIIFGNEASGLNYIENTTALNIPMPGDFESLNVAQAVTVVLFEYVRRNL